MTPERYLRITRVLARRQPDLTVITDQVHKQRNLAAIVRNCDAVGIDTIHCVVPETGYQMYSGTSASAERWVQTKYYSRIEEPIMQLKIQGFHIVSASLSARAVDYREFDYTRPTALIMGAEVRGLSKKGASLCDCEVMLPMLGMVESYNVSVANALILAQAQGQREKAGMYQTRRLPEALYQKRFFTWAHPEIAEYCDRANIAYPAVDGSGEIINLPQWFADVTETADETQKTKKRPDVSGGRPSG